MLMRRRLLLPCRTVHRQSPFAHASSPAAKPQSPVLTVSDASRCRDLGPVRQLPRRRCQDGREEDALVLVRGHLHLRRRVQVLNSRAEERS